MTKKTPHGATPKKAGGGAGCITDVNAHTLRHNGRFSGALVGKGEYEFLRLGRACPGRKKHKRKKKKKQTF